MFFLIKPKSKDRVGSSEEEAQKEAEKKIEQTERKAKQRKRRRYKSLIYEAYKDEPRSVSNSLGLWSRLKELKEIYAEEREAQRQREERRLRHVQKRNERAAEKGAGKPRAKPSSARSDATGATSSSKSNAPGRKAQSERPKGLLRWLCGNGEGRKGDDCIQLTKSRGGED